MMGFQPRIVKDRRDTESTLKVPCPKVTRATGQSTYPTCVRHGEAGEAGKRQADKAGKYDRPIRTHQIGNYCCKLIGSSN